MMIETYFQEIDNELKAYILGTIVFNIKNSDTDELVIHLDTLHSIPPIINKELQKIGTNFESDMFVIRSAKMINDIHRHTSKLNKYHSIDIADFAKNNKKEYVVEFLKAYFEKHATISHIGALNDTDPTDTGGYLCNITEYSKNNLEVFTEIFKVPNKMSNLFNLVQLSYTNVNIIDLLGIIYKNHQIHINNDLYMKFLKLLNNKRPVLKYMKTSDDAVIPTKANFSDVGYDLSIIGVQSVMSSTTTLYKTGIKLEIPIGYYVEIVPRSSISKSGYILANSIGIIDCSYKGELLVALAKQNQDASDIAFPFRCCQLIMRKQIFPDMIEISEIETTKRLEGGFGSSK
jgi:deoxyuridine 5'-triphosphate nucleotidohydrolase